MDSNGPMSTTIAAPLYHCQHTHTHKHKHYQQCRQRPCVVPTPLQLNHFTDELLFTSDEVFCAKISSKMVNTFGTEFSEYYREFVAKSVAIG